MQIYIAIMVLAHTSNTSIATDANVYVFCKVLCLVARTDEVGDSEVSLTGLTCLSVMLPQS